MERDNKSSVRWMSEADETRPRVSSHTRDAVKKDPELQRIEQRLARHANVAARRLDEIERLREQLPTPEARRAEREFLARAERGPGPGETALKGTFDDAEEQIRGYLSGVRREQVVDDAGRPAFDPNTGRTVYRDTGNFGGARARYDRRDPYGIPEWQAGEGFEDLHSRYSRAIPGIESRRNTRQSQWSLIAGYRNPRARTPREVHSDALETATTRFDRGLEVERNPYGTFREIERDLQSVEELIAATPDNAAGALGDDLDYLKYLRQRLRREMELIPEDLRLPPTTGGIGLADPSYLAGGAPSPGTAGDAAPPHRFQQGVTLFDIEGLKYEMDAAHADKNLLAMQSLLEDADVMRDAIRFELNAANAEYDRTSQELAEAKKAVDEQNRNLPKGKRPIKAEHDRYLNWTGILFDEEDAKVYEQWVEARRKGFQDPFEARRKRVNRLLTILAVVVVILLIVWLLSL